MKFKLFIPLTNSDPYVLRIIQYLEKVSNFIITNNEGEANAFIIPFAGFNGGNCSFLLEKKDYKKPIIIIDFMEYGVHRLRSENYFTDICTNVFLNVDTNIFADRINTYEFSRQLHEFLKVNTHNIKIYFMRELSKHVFNEQKKYFPFCVQPIDYVLASNYTDFEPVNKEAFLTRNLKTAFLWGRTNPDRMNLQGAILSQSSSNILFDNVILSLEQYDNYIKHQKKQGILLLSKNGYERVSFLPILNNSYTFIDMYGNGMKCFRNPESAYNCVSLKQDYSQIKFAYDWIDNFNCIMLPNMQHKNIINVDGAADIIINIATNKFDENKLYEIYINSCETSKKYFIDNYTNNHVAAHINKVLEL